MTRCPSCTSPRVYPSRLRTGVERIRRALTERQPYRCHACGFRGWSEILVPVGGGESTSDELRTGGVAAPLTPRELDSLDRDD